MRPGGGKDKGGEFEREMSKLLSLWLSHGERKDLIWRSESSGARFTCTGHGTAGDLMATHPLAMEFCSHFVIECKFWKDLDMTAFLACKGDLYTALEKVAGEASIKLNSWMLIAKQNHRPEFVFIDAGSVRLLAAMKDCIIRRHHKLFTHSASKSCYMFFLREFLEDIKPEQLIKVLTQ